VQRSYHVASLPVVPYYNVVALYVHTKQCIPTTAQYNFIAVTKKNPFKNEHLVFRGVDNHDMIFFSKSCSHSTISII